MNAISPNDFMEDVATEHPSGSDSDTNIDDDDAAEYYQPVSAVDSEDEEQIGNDTVRSNPQMLSNGVIVDHAERGISSLRLNDDVQRNGNSSSEDEEEDDVEEGEEERRAREASDSAVMRAFREDENRRNAPLTPENATRVMEAMRGISFAGVAPDWADRVPEDSWIDRLRGLRRSPQS